MTNSIFNFIEDQKIKKPVPKNWFFVMNLVFYVEPKSNIRNGTSRLSR